MNGNPLGKLYLLQDITDDQQKLNDGLWRLLLIIIGAIAKSLIEGMNGRITRRSKPGEGSIFTITLPLWNP